MTEPYRIRSPETWAQARDDYLAGMDAEAVCRRHDLGLSAFRRRAREYGWRRVDQDDPAARTPDWDVDLSLYDDVGLDEQVRMAHQRFTRALAHGRPIEAARWRRLWRELCADSQALDADFFRGMSPAEVAALLADEARGDETEAEVRLLSAGRRDALPAPAVPAARREAAPGNVHDVHSIFSSAHFPAEGPAGRSDPAPRATGRPAARPDLSPPPAAS